MVWTPSSVLSSTPVRVTVCGVFQFVESNVSEPLVVTSFTSFEFTVSTTGDVGCELRTTVKVSFVPDSSTVVEPFVSV